MSLLDGYVIPFGHPNVKNKRLQDIPLKVLDNFLGWMETQDNPTSKFVEVKTTIKQYLDEHAQELEQELEYD